MRAHRELVEKRHQVVARFQAPAKHALVQRPPEHGLTGALQRGQREALAQQVQRQ